MIKPLPLAIGLRYTRAKRRSHFISFIALISMFGLALGVAVLIAVLSVMNGFEAELRGIILGISAQATAVQRGGLLEDWQGLSRSLQRFPEVKGVAPFIRGEAMLLRSGNVKGALIHGILPAEEPKVSILNEKMLQGSLGDLEPGAHKILLGRELAKLLKAQVGDVVSVVAPQPNAEPGEIMPDLAQFTVAGIFAAEMYDYDSSLAFIHQNDAAELYRLGAAVTGLHLKFGDVYAAPAISRAIGENLGELYAVIDWTQYHVNFFRSLKTQKAMMFLILALIVAVAAFNIVSALVMVVRDKQGDVAILRTLGMSAREIMGVFVVQGTVIGLVGILAGIGGGVLLANNVEAILQGLEKLVHVQLLPPDVYKLGKLSAELQWLDVTRISGFAFALCLLATLYPAWRAARTQPAEVLRYE
jgi:lipoprotein-releasing system permease protein